MPVAAVLFDLYDTLVYVEASAYEAAQRELARLAGVPVETFTAIWCRCRRQASLGLLPSTADHVRAVLEALDLAADEQRVRDMAEREQRFQLEAARLYPGTRWTLDCLKQHGLKLGLVCNNPAVVRPVPLRLGIAHYFDAQVFSCDVGVCKPNPQIYRLACEQLGVVPSSALYVGDGNDRELDGAHALGMRTVWLDQPRNPLWGRSSSTIYDHHLTNLESIPMLIKL